MFFTSNPNGIVLPHQTSIQSAGGRPEQHAAEIDLHRDADGSFRLMRLMSSWPGQAGHDKKMPHAASVFSTSLIQYEVP